MAVSSMILEVSIGTIGIFWEGGLCSTAGFIRGESRRGGFGVSFGGESLLVALDSELVRGTPALSIGTDSTPTGAA